MTINQLITTMFYMLAFTYIFVVFQSKAEQDTGKRKKPSDRLALQELLTTSRRYNVTLPRDHVTYIESPLNSGLFATCNLIVL